MQSLSKFQQHGNRKTYPKIHRKPQGNPNSLNNPEKEKKLEDSYPDLKTHYKDSNQNSVALTERERYTWIKGIDQRAQK